MAAADTIITAPTGSENSTEIVQQARGGGVMDDLLQQKETQRVVEMRDKYYRVLREADKWDASNITIVSEDEDGVTFGNVDSVRKKTKLDFMKHPPVYNEENLPIKTIQDNKQFQKQNNLISGFNAVFDPDLLPHGLTDFETTLTIERDGFRPRFDLEKYTKRIVVRENGDRVLVDLYLPIHASQFGKVDAILIANLYNIWEEKNLRSDLTDFKTMWWYSDKAWGSEDVCLFKYDDIKFIGTNVFDGSFVLTFDCNIVENGTDLTAKYHTEELDKKYENEETKTDAIDVFTLLRHEKRKEERENGIDVNNLTNTTLKLS
jgi:hypothetical protein